MIIKKGIFLCIAGAILSGGATTAASGPDSGWAPLLNGRNFDGWYTYLPSTGKNNENKRDGRLPYFFNGPDKIWPRSLEFQIQETDVGDLWLLDGSKITTKVETDALPMYVLSGPLKTQSRGRILLQAEGAEVWFRNVEMKPLDAKATSSR